MISSKRVFIPCPKSKGKGRQSTEICIKCEINVTCKSYQDHLKEMSDSDGEKQNEHGCTRLRVEF